MAALAKVHTDAIPAGAGSANPCAVACAASEESTPVATLATSSALGAILDVAGSATTCGVASVAFGTSTPMATLAACPTLTLLASTPTKSDILLIRKSL